MKQNKERLFEVMGRLDKTFKPKMNEELEIVGGADDMEEIPAENGEQLPIEEPVEEKSVEEKYEELKEKVGELYDMINGQEGEEELEVEPEGGEEIPTDEPEINGEEGQEEIEM